MTEYKKVNDLKVKSALYDFVEQELVAGLSFSSKQVWQLLNELITKYGEENRWLLQKRDKFQQQLDQWFLQKHERTEEVTELMLMDFLKSIDYVVAEPGNFTITTTQIDEEIANHSAPQLVVPVNNARFALNAVNARWGSLYAALYRSDVVVDAPPLQHTAYDSTRGKAVIEYVTRFLDTAVPLEIGSHGDAIDYRLQLDSATKLIVTLADGQKTKLHNEDLLVGYDVYPTIDAHDNELHKLLFKHHGLHIEVQFDKSHHVGREHPAHIKDVILEAALTTIQDFEDSVTAVDVDDKILVYRNWLRLMDKSLQISFEKNRESITRNMNPLRVYRDIKNPHQKLTLYSRSLMFARNVGIHMYTDIVLDHHDKEIPEGILDAVITTFASLHDIGTQRDGRNSQFGNIYIVKPKLHGAEEVAYTVNLFDSIEEFVGLKANTIKIGIMDEEKRTSMNLKACLAAANERVVFINTGFLDRTGDEIHSIMEAGVVLPKDKMKTCPWIEAYETRNVDVGIASGLNGKAQIGKGMWPMPDAMADMVKTKLDHLKEGANCAWVPSPKAAVLHAMHYHWVDVTEIQQELASRKSIPKTQLLTLANIDRQALDDEMIIYELESNVQSILGYVVRWVNQGIGCSKVPNLNNVELMEDRATLRISSQLLANWLHHGVIEKDQVLHAFYRMSLLVDEQNRLDELYIPMNLSTENKPAGTAFNAALSLVMNGRIQPNGYTEWILSQARREKKADN